MENNQNTSRDRKKALPAETDVQEFNKQAICPAVRPAMNYPTDISMDVHTTFTLEKLSTIKGLFTNACLQFSEISEKLSRGCRLSAHCYEGA
ncbi:MAG: hypothetical protein NTU98_00425 [Bacteroidetes bacterium]|nr:hypothetical protein [Bacteroidota bacterium]